MKYCYIRQDYFDEHSEFINLLKGNSQNDLNSRTYLCLQITYNGNNILIPLRNNLGEAIRVYGKIGYQVPSASRPNAGLDYRNIIIINEERYLVFLEPLIPRRQKKIIADNYKIIEKEALNYIRGYIRATQKGRVGCKALFRSSSLINFHKELGLMDNIKILKVYNDIAISEQQIAEGKTRDAREALEDIRKKYGL